MSSSTDVVGWLTDSAHWRGPDGIVTRTIEHVGVSSLSLGLACAIAIPVALWLGHIGHGGFIALNVTNIGRAVPTFALLSIFSLTALGFGSRSVILALVLFGMPPIMTNTYVGLREVDKDTVEAARGMGMTGAQMLRRVELPLATPLLMNGVRLAAVQIVATLTIAALVAGPGLGRIISQGFGTKNQAELVAGALLVMVLALITEGLFALLQHVIDPVGRARRIAAATAARGVAPVTESA